MPHVLRFDVQYSMPFAVIVDVLALMSCTADHSIRDLMPLLDVVPFIVPLSAMIHLLPFPSCGCRLQAHITRTVYIPAHQVSGRWIFQDQIVLDPRR